MNLKRKRILRVILPMLLIVSFLAQSVTSLALPNADTNDVGDGSNANTVDAATFRFNGRGGWIFSVQEVDNAVLSGRVSSADGYSECAVSIVDKYLYDYPTEYVYDYATNAQNYAYVEYAGDNQWRNTSGGYTLSTAKKAMDGYRNTSKTFANSYSSQAAASLVGGLRNAEVLAANFNSAAQLLDSDSSIVQGLKDRSLEGSYAIAVANNSGKLNEAIKAFVSLWAISGSADDAINDFIYGGDGEDFDHYDVLLRYLDFIIIVNAMCNNAYDSYINDFCTYQNDDYASVFITVVIAAAISIDADSSNSHQGAITLPNYYAARNDSISVEGLLHYDGIGGGDIFDTTSETSDDWAAAQSFYEANAPESSTYALASDANARKWWWNTSDYGFAKSAVPEGLGEMLAVTWAIRIFQRSMSILQPLPKSTTQPTLTSSSSFAFPSAQTIIC